MAYDPEYQRAYNQRPEVKARKKAWRQENPEKELERKRRWREQNPDKDRASKLKWAKANREEASERAKARYEENRDTILAQRREYHDANRDRIRAYHRNYYAENSDAAKARAREWAKANPEKMRTFRAKRRAQTYAVPCEDIDYLVVFARDDGVCGICGDAVNPADWHLDHITPLSRGGHHLYENVQVAHPACNHRKGATMPSPRG